MHTAPIWQFRPAFALSGSRVEIETGNGVTITIEDGTLRMQDEAIKTSRNFTTNGIVQPIDRIIEIALRANMSPPHILEIDRSGAISQLRSIEYQAL